jgi:hypothetical protein
MLIFELNQQKKGQLDLVTNRKIITDFENIRISCLLIKCDICLPLLHVIYYALRYFSCFYKQMVN